MQQGSKLQSSKVQTLKTTKAAIRNLQLQTVTGTPWKFESVDISKVWVLGDVDKISDVVQCKGLLDVCGWHRMTRMTSVSWGNIREHWGTFGWIQVWFVQWIFQGEFLNFQQRWKTCEMATVSSVIFAGAHKYLQSFRMSIQYPRNICDVWKKNQSIPIIPRWPLITSACTYPRVDLTLRTDWCVRLPCIIVDPRNYFRSFHMCIYHLQNVCDMCKKFSLFPSYLAHPYQHQHVPTRRLGVANRLMRMATMHYL